MASVLRPNSSGVPARDLNVLKNESRCWQLLAPSCQDTKTQVGVEGRGRIDSKAGRVEDTPDPAGAPRAWGWRWHQQETLLDMDP